MALFCCRYPWCVILTISGGRPSRGFSCHSRNIYISKDENRGEGSYSLANGRKCGHSGGWSVEGLYCKRSIQCLVSSEILTPHPLTARRACTPPPRLWWEGRTHSLGGEGVEGSLVRKTPETALYSIFVSTLCIGAKKSHKIELSPKIYRSIKFPATARGYRGNAVATVFTSLFSFLKAMLLTCRKMQHPLCASFTSLAYRKKPLTIYTMF